MASTATRAAGPNTELFYSALQLREVLFDGKRYGFGNVSEVYDNTLRFALVRDQFVIASCEVKRTEPIFDIQSHVVTELNFTADVADAELSRVFLDLVLRRTQGIDNPDTRFAVKDSGRWLKGFAKSRKAKLAKCTKTDGTTVNLHWHGQEAYSFKYAGVFAA